MKNTNSEIIEISQTSIKDKIYIIRNQKVMIDSDLAKIYGYTTKTFNQQVKNNIEKFEDDFRFQLTNDEFAKILRSKKLTSMIEKEKRGGRTYNPYVFTEQGIIGHEKILQLSLQTTENTNAIKQIEKNMATKKELVKVMKNFVNSNMLKEFLILNGQTVEADIAYANIYNLARKSIYVIDNYIGLKTLALLKNVKNDVKITIFSDNIGKKLHKIEYEDFIKEYPNVNISFKTTNKIYHDRYIIIDYKSETEHVYHCGSSSKDAGKKITTIAEVRDKELYYTMIDSLLKNKELDF